MSITKILGPLLLNILFFSGHIKANPSKTLACPFSESVKVSQSGNPSDKLKLPGHNLFVIPTELLANFDFVIENGVRTPTELHLRACVCKSLSCIRFCCSEDYYYDIHTHKCIVRGINDTLSSLDSLKIHHSNGSLVRIDGDGIVPQTYVPCRKMKPIKLEANPIQWTFHKVCTNLKCFKRITANFKIQPIFKKISTSDHLETNPRKFRVESYFLEILDV